MFTLIYLNSRFNKPTTLLPFLQDKNTPILRVNCVTPYMGTKDELARSVCDYLSSLMPNLSVMRDKVLNASMENMDGGIVVNYLDIQSMCNIISNLYAT